MALPYPTKVVLPFDIATAQDMNERHANDVALAAGTGLDDGAVTASKTSFGGNFTTSEVNTGFTWVDGKTIYKKTVSIGPLPNAGTKTVAHGITGVEYVISLSGFAKNPSTNLILPLPYVEANDAGAVPARTTSTDIVVVTGVDRTSYTTSYVTLWYTKT